MKNVTFHLSPKNHHAFGLLLIETMSPRTFKNRPIWSHWSADKKDNYFIQWGEESEALYTLINPLSSSVHSFFVNLLCFKLLLLNVYSSGLLLSLLLLGIFKWAMPGLFFVYFRLLQNKQYIFTTNELAIRRSEWHSFLSKNCIVSGDQRYDRNFVVLPSKILADLGRLSDLLTSWLR